MATSSDAKDIDWDTYTGSDDEELGSIRDARLNQLKQIHNKSQDMAAKGHGTYEEITEEDFLPTVTGSPIVVVHFYKDEFQRCKIMNMHLEKLAHKYYYTKFVKLEAEKAPFFVGKLAIKTLPTVVCFMDGRSVDRLIGFEQLGMTDEFQTQTLEARLGQFGVIPYVQKAMNLNRKQKSVRRGVDADSGSDEDDIFG